MVTDDPSVVNGDMHSSAMAKSQGVIRVSGTNVTGNPTVTTASLLETVAEQVVEEGQQLVLGQDQQMVMVTQGDMGGGHQQIVITDGSGQFAPGTQVIQLQGGQADQFIMRSFKTEPEDLSVQVPTTRTINLEAGAQAIQASAAAAVQNVIRSLKDSDKMMLQQILPNHMLAQGPRDQSILIVEGGGQEDTSESDLGSAEVTPSKRSRGSTSEQTRVQIAKQYTPFGFHCLLEAPTAQWVRKDEDRCTYLNKVQQAVQQFVVLWSSYGVLETYYCKAFVLQ